MHDTASRSLYFTIGLLMSLLVVYTAFSWEVNKPIAAKTVNEEKKEQAIPDELTELPAPEELTAVPEVLPELINENAEEIITEPEKVKIEEKKAPKDSGKAPGENIAAAPDTFPAPRPEVSAASEGEVFSTVDERPVPEPGWEAFNKYLKTELIYPPVAQKNEKTGKVYVQFVVDKSGHVRDVKLLQRGLGMGCDEEAIRLIKNSPRWIPGKKNGIPVNTRLIWPVEFKIN